MAQSTFVSSLVQDQRRSTRAPLNMPIRVRWPEPLRHLIEVSQTLDVSRTGLLFYRADPCPLQARVWVTYPYSAENPATQPEIPARVVRVKTTPTGGHLVALHLEPQRRSVASVGKFNRRGGERSHVALPLSVRPAGAPWPEEAMTVDISNGGVLFRTARLYALGDNVRIVMTQGGWASNTEMDARVVRIEPEANSVEQRVALAFLR